MLEHRVSVQWEVVAAEAQPLATKNTKVSSRCYRDVSATRVFTGISPTYFMSIDYVQKKGYVYYGRIFRKEVLLLRTISVELPSIYFKEGYLSLHFDR